MLLSEESQAYIKCICINPVAVAKRKVSHHPVLFRSLRRSYQQVVHLFRCFAELVLQMEKPMSEAKQVREGIADHPNSISRNASASFSSLSWY